MKKILITLLILINSIYLFSQSGLKFDKQLLHCIVLLEKKVESKYIPHGTGFVLFNYEEGRPNILITCEHLLRNAEISIAIPIDSIFADRLRKSDVSKVPFGNYYWILDGNKLRYNYELIEDSTFICDKSLDIGLIPLSVSNSVIVKENGISETLKIMDFKTIPNSLIRFKKDIELGTSVYFIGFPYSIGTEIGFYPDTTTGMYTSNIPNPLLRFGTVAWKSSDSQEFLLDAFSYSGNSGSPIFTQVDNFNTKPYLIGMVKGHLPSQKSENIGLARCVWIDDIMSLIIKLNKLKKPLLPRD